MKDNKQEKRRFERVKSVVVGRKGGERVEMAVKVMVALRLQERPEERQATIAEMYRVSQSLVSGVLRRLTAHCREVGAVGKREKLKRGTREHLQRITLNTSLLWRLLSEKKRGGEHRRSKQCTCMHRQCVVLCDNWATHVNECNDYYQQLH